jgi:hypothetical protein
MLISETLRGSTMRLAAEIHAEMQAFVTGRIGVHDLEGGLDSVAAEVHAEGDTALRALTDRTYALLAEISYGDRTVEDARRSLASGVDVDARDDGVAF